METKRYFLPAVPHKMMPHTSVAATGISLSLIHI